VHSATDPPAGAGRRLSARALWGLAGWALPLAVVFAVTPSLLRALGPERFGVLMIILLTPLLAGQMELGITSSSIRRLAATLASGRVDAGRTLVTLMAALGAVGVSLGAVIWSAAVPISRWLGFASTLGNESGVEVIRWCAVWMGVCQVTLLPGMLARSVQALAWITGIQTLGSALLWLSALALAMAGRPLSEVVAVGIGLSIASALATSVAMRHHVSWRGPVRFDVSFLTEDRRFAAGMFASQAASALVYQGDRILIAAAGSTATAGAYAVCANVANKMLAAVVALTSFAFPHAAGLHALGERARLEALIHALDRSVAVVVMPAIIPGWILAGPFLSLWLGEFATSDLVTAFRVLWLAFAIPAFAVPVGNMLAAHGNAGLAARFSWLTAVVVLGSILLLVPPLGVRGAAVAMLLGMSTSFAFAIAARRSLALLPAPGRSRFWLGIAVGLAAQSLLLVAVHARVTGWNSLLLAGSSAIVAFYAMRAIFKLLSPEEMQLLQRLAVRLRRKGKL
jgi:O-antigen/teichoic acid export membrane protein